MREEYDIIEDLKRADTPELKELYLSELKKYRERPLYDFTEKELAMNREEIAIKYGHSFFTNAVIYGVEWMKTKLRGKHLNDEIQLEAIKYAKEHDNWCSSEVIETFKDAINWYKRNL